MAPFRLELVVETAFHGDNAGMARFNDGEVMPMFFVGATLGNVLAHLMGAPVELFAALGFVAVFAARSTRRWRAR